MKIALLVAAATALVLGPATASHAGVGQDVKDSWITSKAKTKFVFNGDVKARRIKVETRQGVVTLRGKVGTAEERASAEHIARDLDGVTSVRNALEVVPDTIRDNVNAKDDQLIQTVRERLDGDAQFKEAEIRVRADNGVVTLMGNVPNAKAKDRAIEMTRKTPGVRGVRNELQPKS
jgi:osmotically-inducible protein OsmY